MTYISAQLTPKVLRLFVVSVELMEKLIVELPVWGYQINLSVAPDIYCQVLKRSRQFQLNKKGQKQKGTK